MLKYEIKIFANRKEIYKHGELRGLVISRFFASASPIALFTRNKRKKCIIHALSKHAKELRRVKRFIDAKIEQYEIENNPYKYSNLTTARAHIMEHLAAVKRCSFLHYENTDFAPLKKEFPWHLMQFEHLEKANELASRYLNPELRSIFYPTWNENLKQFEKEPISYEW